MTLAFQGIGAVTTNATNDTGVAAVTVDEIETLSIEANANAAGTVTTNGVESLSAQAATGITITGSADIDFDAFVNTTKLVSLDASAATGKLTLTGLDASAIVVKAGAKALTLSMAGLTNADQIIGGASATDAVSALAVTGLTSATGILNIQDVETVNLAATGANTIDTSLMTGVTTLAISGATPGTQTVTNVAASGLSVSAGTATDEFDNAAQLEIKLADETGSADALTVGVDNRGGTATDVTLKTTGIETVTLDVLDLDTGNNAAVDMTAVKASTVNVTGGYAAALITMTTLAAETTTVNLVDYKGDVSFTAGATGSGMTVTASASAAADDFTLSAKNDTITIAETGAVAVDVDGAGGTDTLNLSIKTGFIDTGEIDNVENLNLTVAAGADISLGANGTANTDANGFSEATTVTITGGNSLSVFEVGDASAAMADNITAATDINASAFEGAVHLEFNTDIFTATTDVDAGGLTTDVVQGLFDTGGTDIKLPLTGVEKFRASLDTGGDGDEQYTFDVEGATGLTHIQVASSDGENTLLDVDNYVDTVTVELGASLSGTVTAYASSSEVDINLASSAGTADTVNLKLTDTDDQAGTIDIDAAGVEALNIVLGTGTESHKLNLAGVAATTLSNQKITVTGGIAGDGLEITAIHSTVNEIDASALLGTLTMTGSNTTAMTVTGGTAADTIMMQHGSDVLNGGALTEGNTLDINKAMVLGGIAVDLTSTTDQVTTFNGAANSAAQTGFYHVDLAGVTGSFGSDITANAAGSTITGTANADVITGGAGADTVMGMVGTDTISTGGGSDTFVINAAQAAGVGTIDLGSGTADVISYTLATGSAGDFAETISTAETLVIDAGAVNTTQANNLINLNSMNATKLTNVDTLDNVSNLVTVDASAVDNTNGMQFVTHATNANTIKGSKQADLITYSGGNDTIDGNGGVDTFSFTEALLIANSGTTATFDGDTGDDILLFGEDDVIDVVDADFRGMTSIAALTTANGTNNVVLGANAQATGIATVTGGTGADTINASSYTSGQALTVTGGNGADIITLGAANDTYVVTLLTDLTDGSNAVEDDVDAGGGSGDAIAFAGGVTLAAADDFTGLFTNFEKVTARGAESTAIELNFHVTFRSDTGITTVTLAADTDATATNVINFDVVTGGAMSITGSAGVDTITGTAAADTIDGGDGNDSIVFAATLKSGDSAGDAADLAASLTAGDTITAFVTADDSFVLDETVFGNMGNGASIGGTPAAIATAQFANVANGGIALNGSISDASGALDVTGNGAIVYVADDKKAYFVEAGATLAAGGMDSMVVGTNVVLLGTIGTLTGTLAAADFMVQQ